MLDHSPQRYHWLLSCVQKSHTVDFVPFHLFMPCSEEEENGQCVKTLCTPCAVQTGHSGPHGPLQSFDITGMKKQVGKCIEGSWTVLVHPVQSSVDGD